MAKKTTLPTETLLEIVLAAIAAMESDHSFALYDLSVLADGAPASVWEDLAERRDAFGWILKKSYDHERVVEAGRRLRQQISYKVSEDISAEMLALTGRTLVGTSEDKGREAVVRALGTVAERLRAKLEPNLKA